MDNDLVMTLCPVALAVHCTGCPIVNACPAKTIIGDYDANKPDEPNGESRPKDQ